LSSQRDEVWATSTPTIASGYEETAGELTTNSLSCQFTICFLIYDKTLTV